MELKVEERSGAKKSESKQLRRAGKIPAVVYGGNGENRNVTVDGSEFEKHLRSIKKGCLPTTLFTLGGAGKGSRALVKDIQYHVTTYDVLHLDFQEVSDEKRVNVNVPLRIIGGVDCPGVKLGGVVRQVIRFLRVSCLPSQIPSELTLDVRELEMAGTKRLRDIALPEGVRALAKMEEVAVVIAKR